jgi:SAM-dependent methyltransferase
VSAPRAVDPASGRLSGPRAVDAAGGRSAPRGLDTSTRFGVEWDRYRGLFPHYEEQFRGWIAPLGPGDFAGRDVLDAGCGMGRNSLWAARWGARSVVAIDEAELALAAARQTLAGVPNARVERHSIYALPWRGAFDLVFCVGVIHHLEEPRRALASLLATLRPGGRLLVWLYGYEGNEAWVRCFRLLHPLLRRLPVGAVHALAYLVSVPLFLGLRLPLPKSPYLAQVARFPFAHLHKIVFDQLLPALAHYYRRAEVEALFGDAGLARVEIHHNRGYSWTVIGDVPARS